MLKYVSHKNNIYDKHIHKTLISLNSTDKNADIVRPDVMTEVRILVLSPCVCEFTMILSSRLSTKK